MLVPQSAATPEIGSEGPPARMTQLESSVKALPLPPAVCPTKVVEEVSGHANIRIQFFTAATCVTHYYGYGYGYILGPSPVPPI